MTPIRQKFTSPAGARFWCGAWLGLWLAFAPPLAALNPDRKADSYSIQGWTTEQGLPSNKIRAVTQARDGYLWLATAQGIARFDGSRFTVFNGATHPVLRGGGFYAVQETSDGALWFGGDNGLFRWHRGQFERFTTAQGLAHNVVRALALTRDGAIVACTGAGYSVMREGRITTPGGVWKEATGVTRAYLERADGSILLGTEEGLWRVSGETITRLSGTAGLDASGFNSLLETADGTLWIAHSLGVRCLRPDGTTEDYGVAQGLTIPRTAALLFDRDGNLWIAGYGNLHRLARGRIERASYAGQLVGTTIQQLHEDREGGLWVATAIGLFRLKDNMSRIIGAAEGLAQTAAYTVLEAKDNAWWIGLWGGGVYRYDQARATSLAVPAMLGLDQVLALHEEPAGTLWIGSYSGLYRHTAGATVNLYDKDQAAAWQKQLADRPGSALPGIAHAHVNSIAADGAGGLWVATDGALYHGREGDFRATTLADGLPGYVFKSVIRARNGDIWTTVPPFGAARLHNGQWTNYRCGQELSDVFPRAIYEDLAGSIWVTTEGGGINRFKDGKWRIFTVSDGLSDDFISGMTEDTLGNFWIASPRGVMRIPRVEFDQLDTGRRVAVQPRIFNRFDGLPAGETNQQGSPNAWQTRDGRLLFATDRGVAVVDPANIPINTLKPPLYIERLVVNGAAVDLTRPVVVPPGVNDFHIYYTAISLLAPEKVRFKIRLTPIEAEWVEADERREVHYAALPPGDYTFRVKACNNDSIWNEEGVQVAFTVQPHFYQTPWFTGFVIVAAGLATLVIYRRRSRRAERQMALLSGLVAERTSELQAAKERAEAAVVARNDSIAALQRAQAEIAGERATFKFIFDAVPVGIAFDLLDEKKTLLVNPAHSRITGLQPAELHEPGAFDRVTHPDDLARQRAFTRSYKKGEIDHFTLEKRYLHPPDEIVWATLTRRLVVDPVTGVRRSLTTLVDITERKAAEARLEDTHRQLLEVSRQAGMAEVATGVLHNVGNVLNSVNVSATLVAGHVRKSKAGSIGKLAALLAEHEADLADFLTRDPRGQTIPLYLQTLAEALATEQTAVFTELDDLRKNVEHIKEIVAMQQSYARASGVTEIVAVPDLVEDALRINAGALVRHDVKTVRDYQARPVVTTDKHKVMQILINLVRNAKYACDESGRTDKQLTARITSGDNRVAIAIIDNGVGIPAENLTRIFAHGFTTRKHGHGFGLHSGALAAKEIGGSLTVASEGPGKGASFILELPLQPASPPS